MTPEQRDENARCRRLADAHHSDVNCEIPLEYPGNPSGFALDVTVVTEEHPDLFEWYLGF